MLKSINKKNQHLVNRAIYWLIQYDEANDLRNRANDECNERLEAKYDRLCWKLWDKAQEVLGELPKYEVKRIEKSIFY
jgi:hypothetical protein